MRYRALIAGMLGDVPFEAGEILELADEVAYSWWEQLLLVACDDQTVPADHTPPAGVIPTAPQPQQPDPEVAAVAAEVPPPPPTPEPAAPPAAPEAPPEPAPEPPPPPEPEPAPDPPAEPSAST